MAQMFPPVCSAKVTSSGERLIFEELRNAPNSDNWYCLHSLELSSHVTKVCGEIDFVVAVPGEGIFCLEVKSGKVSRVGGTWLYENRLGHIHTNFEGPFKQARTGMFSLYRLIESEFDREDRLRKVVYDSGVVLPDVEFDESGPDMDSWRVYDNRSRRYPINQFIKKLSDRSHEDLKNCRWYDEKESRPTEADIKRLVKFLRGDFELNVKRGFYAEELHKEIIRLTYEQIRCLENLRDNPRCFFTGAAGTGKTVLAVEFAKREATKGKKVLFLCYNRLLAHRLRTEFSEFKDLIVADHFHHYLDELVLRSSFKDTFILEKANTNQDDMFKKVFPLFALEVLENGDEQPFDVLVVDECQDLLLPDYMDVFDAVVEGGLANGHWGFFGDMHFQNIFNRDLPPEEMTRDLETRAPSHVKFRLNQNCRNTRNIGKDTCRIVGFEEPPYRTSAVSGSPVEYLYYSDPSEQTEIIQSIIRELDFEGIQRDDITVLCRRRLQNSSLTNQLPQIDFNFRDITKNDAGWEDENGLNFCTIQSFKGLENSVIIVTDMSELDSGYAKSLLYVAMSRAHTKLFMLLPKSLKKKVKSLTKSPKETPESFDVSITSHRQHRILSHVNSIY